MHACRSTLEDPTVCGGPTAVAATVTVDGERSEVCLPIDPDATIAVHASPVTAGAPGAIQMRVQRRSAVARNPLVAIALVMDRDDEGHPMWTPIARATLGATQSTGPITVPAWVQGPVWIRVRPVMPGGQEVLGGSASLFLGPVPPRTTLRASESGGGAAGLDVAAPVTEAVFAVDPEHAGELRTQLVAALGEVGVAVAEGRGELFRAALAASRVPADRAVSAVLRERRVEPLALPEGPVALGLLRDPWRTRARFVRGRLGALMRAVEDYVSSHVPSAIDDVAVRDARGWRFNREVLEAALGETGIGDERAAALDGEPLDIDALTALDPAFDYDRVARRITRQRLFVMLRFLREMVRERELDLAWARRGDPRQYPVSVLEAEIGWSEDPPEHDDLFDAWGRPFVLVPVRGRPRFEFLQPVSGFELISTGADGRPGTGDDVADPFARILPSGSVYAEAVGEDVLLARVGSVALGRATVESLAEAFEIETESVEMEDGQAVHVSWDDAPPPLEDLAVPPAPVPLLGEVAGGVREVAPGAEAAFEWSLPPERRPYVAVWLAFSTDGSLGWSSAPFVAGAPVAARFETPATMRPGESLSIPIGVVRLAEAPEPRVTAAVSGGAIRARVVGERVVLEAARPGIARVTLRLDSEGATPWTATRTIRVVPPGSLRATHAGAIAAPEAEFELRLPDGARPWRGAVVIGAPLALRRDPLLRARAMDHAAISAWADVMAGAAVDPELLAAVQRGNATEQPALAAACARVVWAAQIDEEGHPPARWPGRGLEAAPLPEDIGARAAVLAALAPAAPEIVDPASNDVVASVIATLRQDGWRALATASDRPATLARTAAALLLADRRDTIGRALFDRARASLGEHGFPPSVADAYVGTVALAIAARQLGEDALADRLAPVVLARLYLAPRLGSEAIFWVLAASAYGALGAGNPESVQVEIDGTARRVELEGGVATVPAPPGASVRVRAASPVWVRAESRVLRLATTTNASPLRPRLEGEPGRAGERAALELVVESATDEEIAAPVLEVTLPSAAVFDAAALEAVRRSPAVASVTEADPSGVVRIHLAALRGRATHHIPFPVRWLAAGRTRGFPLTAYDATRPWAQTTRPDRQLEVRSP